MNREAVKAALVFILVGLVLGCMLVLGCIIGYGVFGRSKATDYVSERDTSTYIDTIPYYQPVPKDSMVIKYVTRTLPVKRRDSSTTNKTDTFLAENHAQKDGGNIPPQELSDDRDSMAVEIPITQQRYESDEYSAWVSGYAPCLDSIRVYPRTTVIRERERKPPNRWHIGVTGGYGYGIKSKQVEPFVGVGIMYSILSF